MTRKPTPMEKLERLAATCDSVYVDNAIYDVFMGPARKAYRLLEESPAMERVYFLMSNGFSIEDISKLLRDGEANRKLHERLEGADSDEAVKIRKGKK